MDMAVANRDVGTVLMEAESAVLRWDGYGMPPDGGIYEERTDGVNSWFVCVLCNLRCADKSHCCSEAHKNKLRQHVAVTFSRQLVQVPTSLAHVPTPQVQVPTPLARLPKVAPPPPPHAPPSDLANSQSPPPPYPTTREHFEKQEKRINELSVMMDAMNTKLDAIMAVLGRLSAGSQPTGDRAADLKTERAAAAATSDEPSTDRPRSAAAAAQLGEPKGGTWAAAAAGAATSDEPSTDTPAAACRQWVEPKLGTWAAAASVEPSTDTSWSAAAAAPWHERGTSWGAAIASTDTSWAAAAAPWDGEPGTSWEAAVGQRREPS